MTYNVSSGTLSLYTTTTTIMLFVVGFTTPPFLLLNFFGDCYYNGMVSVTINASHYTE